MKYIVATTVAIASLMLAVPSFAGSSSTAISNSDADANAQNSNNQSMRYSQKAPVGTPGSFSGTGCIKYGAVGFPYGSLAFGGTCKVTEDGEGAAIAQRFLGGTSGAEFLCNSPKYKMLSQCKAMAQRTRDVSINRFNERQRIAGYPNREATRKGPPTLVELMARNRNK